MGDINPTVFRTPLSTYQPSSRRCFIQTFWLWKIQSTNPDITELSKPIVQFSKTCISVYKSALHVGNRRFWWDAPTQVNIWLDKCIGVVVGVYFVAVRCKKIQKYQIVGVVVRFQNENGFVTLGKARWPRENVLLHWVNARSPKENDIFTQVNDGSPSEKGL